MVSQEVASDRSRPLRGCSPRAASIPYAPILFDYVRRTMPMTAPQSLTNDQVYALGGVHLEFERPRPRRRGDGCGHVTMPNRNGFILDDRPDTAAKRCISNACGFRGATSSCALLRMRVERAGDLDLAR
jgi:hypothetical protein